MISRGYELEISVTLLTVDLRILDMSKFDVNLWMDWLIAYKIIIDCERRRVTAYTQDGNRWYFRGTRMIFCPIQYTSPSVRDSWRVGSRALPWRTRRGQTWIYFE